MGGWSDWKRDVRIRVLQRKPRRAWFESEYEYRERRLEIEDTWRILMTLHSTLSGPYSITLPLSRASDFLQLCPVVWDKAAGSHMFVRLSPLVPISPCLLQLLVRHADKRSTDQIATRKIQQLRPITSSAAQSVTTLLLSSPCLPSPTSHPWYQYPPQSTHRDYKTARYPWTHSSRCHMSAAELAVPNHP